MMALRASPSWFANNYDVIILEGGILCTASVKIVPSAKKQQHIWSPDRIKPVECDVKGLRNLSTYTMWCTCRGIPRAIIAEVNVLSNYSFDDCIHPAMGCEVPPQLGPGIRLSDCQHLRCLFASVDWVIPFPCTIWHKRRQVLRNTESFLE